MYERLANLLDETEEPHETARAVLEALLEPVPEVLAAGITAEQWRSAIGAMLKSADRVDEARAEEVAADRRIRWRAMRAELERLGCRFWRPSDNDDIWRIEAPGVNVELDLGSGEIDGMDDVGYREDPFDHLVRWTRWRIAHRTDHDAQEARKAELRQRGYTWSNQEKGWIPPGGVGPIIRGGGKAP